MDHTEAFTSGVVGKRKVNAETLLMHLKGQTVILAKRITSHGTTKVKQMRFR